MVRVRSTFRGVESGKQFDQWTVLGNPFSDGNGNWLVVARCSCGRIRTVHCPNLARNLSRNCSSCSTAKRNYRHGDTRRNAKHPRLHDIWCNMRQRCYQENCPAYEWYGAKGVRICSEWQDYVGFKAWALSNGYRDDLTIDRIDNDGNYEPGNCQWITNAENSSKRQKQARLKQNA